MYEAAPIRRLPYIAGVRSHFQRLVVFAALAAAPLVCAAQCAAPPIRSSDQALCYAVAYADKNGLSHRAPLARRVSHTKTVWTVRFVMPKSRPQSGGWEVDIDQKSGNVVRFLGYR